jgi:hypothetical protein
MTANDWLTRNKILASFGHVYEQTSQNRTSKTLISHNGVTERIWLEKNVGARRISKLYKNL